MKAWAAEAARPMTERYRNNPASIRRGRGFYIAKLVERAVCQHFGWRYIDTIHADCSVMLENLVNRKIEVKVKERTVEPLGHYNASVAAANTTQDCHYYLFCSTVRDDEIYIVGIIPKGDFMAGATFRREGELDPDGPAGQNWKFRADCYNMRYDHEAMKPVGRLPLN